MHTKTTRKVVFRLKELVSENDLCTAFEISTNIGLDYFKAEIPNVDFNPSCQEESKLLIPGLKIVFYVNSDVILVVPVKEGNFHKTIDSILSLSKALGKSPAVSIDNKKVTITWKQ